MSHLIAIDDADRNLETADRHVGWAAALGVRRHRRLSACDEAGA